MSQVAESTSTSQAAPEQGGVVGTLKTIPAAIGDSFGGGVYAGIARGVDDAPDYHLVVLPGDVSAEYADALEFASGVGGELPTRREQRLLFANLKDQFQEDWYWSAEQHASDPSYAWGQDFDGGGQGYVPKDDDGRARAVRRLPIQ